LRTSTEKLLDIPRSKEALLSAHSQHEIFCSYFNKKGRFGDRRTGRSLKQYLTIVVLMLSWAKSYFSLDHSILESN
jgi:hypothetical protein